MDLALCALQDGLRARVLRRLMGMGLLQISWVGGPAAGKGSAARRGALHRGVVTLFALKPPAAAAGAVIARGPFTLNTRSARTQIKLNLSAPARLQLRATGELPVLAVTSVSGAPATRRIVMLRRPILPTVITGPAAATLAIGVPSTRAQLQGAILTRGLPTTYHFEYGPTSSYGSSTSDETSKDPTVVVTTVVENLTPGATDHYRLVATNHIGTETGADGSFTMPAGQTGPVPEQGPHASFTVTDNGSRSYTFTDTTTTAPDRAIQSWLWDFGDPTSEQNTANGNIVPHTFSEPGTYVVSETVTDDHGLHDTSSQFVTVP